MREPDVRQPSSCPLDGIPPPERLPYVEWPTVLLLAVIYAAFLALTYWHAAMPLAVWLAAAAWTSAWWGSVQHEVLHGHPTRWRGLNTALATLPMWLWLPFELYRRTHLAHHRDERLTDPLDDPESRYWTPDGWRALGPAGQEIVRLQSTLLGRMTIGPLWSIGSFLVAEARGVRRSADRRNIWAWHLLWTALLLGWAVGVCGVPLWQYGLGFVYFGMSLALVRSFAEHRARDAVDHRTAIVENSPVFGLLFLYNNLHAVHHRWPIVPWYRLPELYRRHRTAFHAANGGLVYDGYGEVARRFLLRPHDGLVHPRGRAPYRSG